MDQSKENSRLVAHLLTLDLAVKPTFETLRFSLEQVADDAYQHLDRILTQIPDATSDGGAHYRSGREHAFYVHQFTNATRALKQLGASAV